MEGYSRSQYHTTRSCEWRDTQDRNITPQDLVNGGDTQDLNITPQEPNQTSKMELYVKIVNPFQSLTIFATSYILDV